MAKIKKGIQEKHLNVKNLYNRYSSICKEDRETKKQIREAFKFIDECEREVAQKLKEIREAKRLEAKLEGLYVEVFEFSENSKRVFRAMNADEMLAYGTDFGKIYHVLLDEQKKIASKRSSIKINGTLVKQEVPEINIIYVEA